MEFPLKSQSKDIEMKPWLPGCAWTSPSDVTCLLCNSAKRLTLIHFLGSFHSSQSSNDCFFYSMTWTRCLCFGFPCLCPQVLGLVHVIAASDPHIPEISVFFFLPHDPRSSSTELLIWDWGHNKTGTQGSGTQRPDMQAYIRTGEGQASLLADLSDSKYCHLPNLQHICCPHAVKSVHKASETLSPREPWPP